MNYHHFDVEDYDLAYLDYGSFQNVSLLDSGVSFETSYDKKDTVEEQASCEEKDTVQNRSLQETAETLDHVRKISIAISTLSCLFLAFMIKWFFFFSECVSFGQWRFF